MGRKIPIDDHDPVSLLHPLLSLSILMATIAMITALCIRRKSTPTPDPPPSSTDVKPSAEDQSGEAATAASASPNQNSEGRTSDDDDSDSKHNKELPLPPALKTLREAYSCNNYSRAMSIKKIHSSLSIKVGRSISVKNHDLHLNKKKGKLKADQDSIWTKTIILGEKCKPDEEDDTVIYDSKGNRISAYHKKNQSNFTLSRTNSFIDQSSYHGSVHGKDKGSVMGKDDDKDKGSVRGKDDDQQQQQQVSTSVQVNE